LRVAIALSRAAGIRIDSKVGADHTSLPGVKRRLQFLRSITNRETRIMRSSPKGIVEIERLARLRLVLLIAFLSEMVASGKVEWSERGERHRRDAAK
jgi:hypothetical protein